MITATTDQHVVDIFASSGVLAAKQGVLPDAIEDLVARLDLAGCGDLVDALAATCWAPDNGDRCPHCGGVVAKRTPSPHRRGGGRGCLTAVPRALAALVRRGLTDRGGR